MLASIDAAEQGTSVVILDDAHGGGATAQSGGMVNAGSSTDQQKAACYGHEAAENMFHYLREESGDAIE